MHGTDAGMVKCGGGARFTLETLQGLGVFVELFGKELQSKKTPETRVFGLVDHTHAPTPQLVKNAVVGDRSADHQAPGRSDEEYSPIDYDATAFTGENVPALAGHAPVDCTPRSSSQRLERVASACPHGSLQKETSKMQPGRAFL